MCLNAPVCRGRLPRRPSGTHGGSHALVSTLHGIVAALAFAVSLAACVGRSRTPVPEAAAEVVTRLEQAIARRDYAAAHALVDYRFRLAEILGPVWRDGSQEAQASLIRQSQAMFEETSERLRAHIDGREFMHVLRRREGPHLWVESVPFGGQPTRLAQEFVWSYRLTPSEDTWSITQREYRVSGVPSDSTRFWPMAMKQIAARYGRPITLEELAANLPSVQGTMRIRGIRVPDLKPPGAKP